MGKADLLLNQQTGLNAGLNSRVESLSVLLISSSCAGAT